MPYLKSWRQNSKIITFISDKLLNSFFYLAIFTLICIIAGTSGKDVYLPCFYIMTALVVFAGIVSTDLKVFFAPAFLGYYAVGMDVAENYYSTWVSPSFDSSSLIPIFICGSIMVLVLIFRLISDGYIKEMLVKRGIFFWGIIFIDISLLLAGFLSSAWSMNSLLFSAIIIVCLTFFYFLFTVVLAHSKDGIAYMCKALICLGLLVGIQVLIIVYRLNLHDNFIYTTQGMIYVKRWKLAFSWGVATIVGGVMVPPIVAALYMMRNRKFPFLSFLSSLFFCAIILLITTRSALIVAALIFAVGLVLCCIGGKNKKHNRVFLISLCVLGAIAVIVIIKKFPNTYEALWEKFLNIIRLNVNIDTEEEFSSFLSNRPPIWKDGLGDFLRSPIFGQGFTYGYFDETTASSNLFMNMYHSIFIQFLASAGIVGLFALLIHFKQFVEVFFRRFDLDKVILLMIPISILIMSLVDNFFFYPNFLIMYTASLAAAEIHLEHKREERLNNLKIPKPDRKPRVVFTYVEAGKGHIVPTRNVCECFKRKYGDQTEVIESRFFTETNDPNLEKTEKLFSKAVKQQNRSPIISFLCKLGNLIAGDTFALQVLLRMTISGRKTNPRAVKHVEELDADIIYTAHWSIPFYVNQLKTPHPYTICFCPDAYSNGAFNVDCNNFLISSDVGYNQTCRFRMYAGGNVSLIPFPMRPEAEAYKAEGKKAECRAKLGISDDEFVVVLCDGGYGMARLEKTAKKLLKAKERITVIALCGTNEALYKKMCAHVENTSENVRLIPVPFTDKMLDYLVCADVFAGKSGANSIAEPTMLNIPVIVTKCITYIERGIKNYYVHKIHGATYIPSSYLAARKIRKFARQPELLEPYRKNLRETKRQHFDAEASADLIWQRLNELGE